MDPLVLFEFNDLTRDPHISAFFFGFQFAAFLWCCGHELDNQRCIAFDLNWLIQPFAHDRSRAVGLFTQGSGGLYVYSKNLLRNFRASQRSRSQGF
jgi:hypothetical protein